MPDFYCVMVRHHRRDNRRGVFGEVIFMKTLLNISFLLWLAFIAAVIVPMGVLMPEYRALIGSVVAGAAGLWLLCWIMNRSIAR